jgi:regulatory protein
MAQDDLLEKTYQKVLNYVSYKPRSEREVVGKITFLLRKNVTDLVQAKSIQETILQRLRDAKLIGDEANITLYVQGYLNSSKPKSVSEIRSYLLSKGYATGDVNTALSSVPEDFELASAENLAQRKLKSLNKYSVFQRRQRLINFLLQKGYRFNIASLVADKILEA